MMILVKKDNWYQPHRQGNLGVIMPKKTLFAHLIYIYTSFVHTPLICAHGFELKSTYVIIRCD